MSPQEKFDNCVHRSPTAQIVTINRCQCAGGPYTVNSFICFRQNITDVKPEICGACPYFEAKNVLVVEDSQVDQKSE